MRTWPKAFATACVFLTRIPMPTMAEISDRDQGRSLLCFPIVGLLIGLLLWAVALLSLPVFGSLVTAAILLALWAAITGGLHLDGLADSADGWLGSYGDPQRTLEIMHDSRSGAGAIIAVTCLLILKFAALTLVLQHQLWVALIVAPVIGRCSGPLLFLRGKLFYAPYVQPSGIAKHFIEFCPSYARPVSYFAILCCGVALGAPFVALAILAICAVMLLLVRRLAMQRLGGVTGDVAGAATEILETVLLLSCGALLV